jgi:hypothetical protein
MNDLLSTTVPDESSMISLKDCERSLQNLIEEDKKGIRTSEEILEEIHELIVTIKGFKPPHFDQQNPIELCAQMRLLKGLYALYYKIDRKTKDRPCGWSSR